MNILIDKLPTTYEGLKINTNFRSFILFELLMQDNKIDKEDKLMVALDLFYEELSPEDLKKAFDGIIWLYTCGKKETQKEKKDTKENNKKQKKVFSYEHDADLIYSAFLDQYGVDLNDIEYLHWWKFKAMFNGLNDKNKLCEIMGYRAINLNEIKDKEQRKRYKKIQRQYALPDERSEEEKEADFANAFW